MEDGYQPTRREVLGEMLSHSGRGVKKVGRGVMAISKLVGGYGIIVGETLIMPYAIPSWRRAMKSSGEIPGEDLSIAEKKVVNAGFTTGLAGDSFQVLFYIYAAREGPFSSSVGSRCASWI